MRYDAAMILWGHFWQLINDTEIKFHMSSICEKLQLKFVWVKGNEDMWRMSKIKGNRTMPTTPKRCAVSSEIFGSLLRIGRMERIHQDRSTVDTMWHIIHLVCDSGEWSNWSPMLSGSAGKTASLSTTSLLSNYKGTCSRSAASLFTGDRRHWHLVVHVRPLTNWDRVHVTRNCTQLTTRRSSWPNIQPQCWLALTAPSFLLSHKE